MGPRAKPMVGKAAGQCFWSCASKRKSIPLSSELDEPRPFSVCPPTPTSHTCGLGRGFREWTA